LGYDVTAFCEISRQETQKRQKMKHNISIDLHLDREAISTIIEGLAALCVEKGKEVEIPYGHPGKDGKSYRYMKSGYELATYSITTDNDVQITFYNLDSDKE
jgi:hypothetical protein